MHTTTAAVSVCHHPCATAGAPARIRWASLAVAIMMAACAHSPQAAVTAGAASPQALSAFVGREGPAAATACRDAEAARVMLRQATREIESLGLALQVRCNAASGAWVAQVRVVDGMKASRVVRGPLADGHDVDMGTPAGVVMPGAPRGATGFSPDVQHNRQWLHALMARHQLDNLPDAWWHFAQRGVQPPNAAQAGAGSGVGEDLAAR